MTNIIALKEAIEKSGYRRTFIAKKAGLTFQGYLNKEEGKTEFRQSEIQAIAELLNLSLEEKERIFFANSVD